MFWITHTTIREAEIGLFYVNGQFVRVVAPGRHRVAVLPWRKEEIVRVDTRRRQMPIAGQEMLTSDGLSVRLNVAAEYRITDAPRALHTVASHELALYSALQVILRDEIQARTLDAVLADRTRIAVEMQARGAREAEEIGLELTRVGIKDIILPGDIKRMLSQEVEAQRAGRAALVAAREETAATRLKLNTARLLSDSPVLLRLREIEALAEVGKGMGNTVVVAVPQEILSAARTLGTIAPLPPPPDAPDGER